VQIGFKSLASTDGELTGGGALVWLSGFGSSTLTGLTDSQYKRIYTGCVRSYLDNILGVPISNRPDSEASLRRRVLFSNPLTRAESSADSLNRRLRMFSRVFKLPDRRNFQTCSEISKSVREGKNVRNK